MTDQMIGYLLLGLSVVIYLVCGATFVAMLQAIPCGQQHYFCNRVRVRHVCDRHPAGCAGQEIL